MLLLFNLANVQQHKNASVFDVCLENFGEAGYQFEVRNLSQFQSFGP